MNNKTYVFTIQKTMRLGDTMSIEVEEENLALIDSLLRMMKEAQVFVDFWFTTIQNSTGESNG